MTSSKRPNWAKSEITLRSDWVTTALRAFLIPAKNWRLVLFLASRIMALSCGVNSSLPFSCGCWVSFCLIRLVEMIKLAAVSLAKR